tara:strand:+ start:1044 stop:2177 length:1134 start_codon:yes stop_codon:yes gene_type:complete
MASLTGSSIASSYTSLLKLNGNTDSLVAGDGSNAIQVVDGDGTTSALYLNTDRLGVGGQPSYTLDVQANLEGNVARFWNDGNDGNRDVLILQGGSDSAPFNSRFITFQDGDGGVVACLQGANGTSNGGIALNITPDTNNLVVDSTGNVGIGVATPVTTLDVHADTVETVAVFGQADDGAAYIATRCGEVQDRPMGYIFQVGSTALTGYSSGTTTATILSTVKNSGGALQGDLNFSTNQGDSLQSRFNIASNGDLTATDTSIGSISDERFKTNIKDYSGGLDTINALRPVTFEHKESTKLREGTQRGFIAQEVEKVDSFWTRKSNATEEDDFYDLVKDDGAEYYISKITEKDTLYVSAIKEMSAQIDALTKRIEVLEA